jgi:hypothetical protein
MHRALIRTAHGPECTRECSTGRGWVKYNPKRRKDFQGVLYFQGVLLGGRLPLAGAAFIPGGSHRGNKRNHRLDTRNLINR